MSSLKESLAARKAECFESEERSFVEFQLTLETRQGFALAQLLHYTLEANPAAGNKDESPERLTLAFSTADVVIFGARLVRKRRLECPLDVIVSTRATTWDGFVVTRTTKRWLAAKWRAAAR
jgi:hypothetical protein